MSVALNRYRVGAAPVPTALLPVKSYWDDPRKATYSTALDHPSVILEEVGYQMEAYWGPAFVANYFRTLADKFDRRQEVFAKQQMEAVNAVD